MSGWQIADYDELLPDEDVLIFNEPGGGVKYKLTLFISTATALKVLQSAEKIKALFEGGKDDVVIYDIMEPLFLRHYDFMNREWIGANFGYTKLLRIMSALYVRVHKAFEKIQQVEETEETKEVKLPAKFYFGSVMRALMSEYGLTPSYILYEMTLPQVVLFFMRPWERDTKPVEETEESIRAQFVKKPGGGYTINKED